MAAPEIVSKEGRGRKDASKKWLLDIPWCCGSSVMAWLGRDFCVSQGIWPFILSLGIKLSGVICPMLAAATISQNLSKKVLNVSSLIFWGNSNQSSSSDGNETGIFSTELLDFPATTWTSLKTKVVLNSFIVPFSVPNIATGEQRENKNGWSKCVFTYLLGPLDFSPLWGSRFPEPHAWHLGEWTGILLGTFGHFSALPPLFE